MIKIYKIIYILFWVNIGILIGMQLIVRKVIMPNSGDNNPGWPYVYNLLDHVVPYYAMSFLLFIILFIILVFLKVKISDNSSKNIK